MVKYNELPEGVSPKLLSSADNGGQEYQFIDSFEHKEESAKRNYYLWLSRLFIVLATASLIVFFLSSLALFKLSMAVTVEPFLVINQDESKNMVRAEPIAIDMPAREMLMETFIRQYVLYRNTIISDEREMMVRWFPGGLVNYLSSQEVYDKFDKEVKKSFQQIINNQISQEVEILSVEKQGGKDSQTWKVDFRTYQVSEKERSNQTGALLLKSRYWTASITSFFISGREFMGVRLLNPLGFTVARYDQDEVSFN